MASWRGYLGVENLALTAAQKATLVSALQRLGPVTHPSPARLCHWRTRLNGEAAIFEAEFDADTISIQAVKQRLADIFGVPIVNITHTTTTPSFAAGTSSIVATLKYGATNRLRLVQFGGPGSSYQDSHGEVLGYLATNAAAWEGAS